MILSPQSSIEIFDNILSFVKSLDLNIIPLNELNVVEEIGFGSQGKVFHGLYKNKTVAIKIAEDVDLKCIKNEIEICSKLNHPNIPKFYGLILQDNLIGIVIEFIKGNTLDEVDLEKLSFRNKLLILKKLFSAVNHMHSMQFIHRDLKPENLLIEGNSGEIFLIDFGISKIVDDDDLVKSRAKGTINYLPPETFDVLETNKYDEIITLNTSKVDVWSLGCITSYLFSGILPWCNTSILKSHQITRKLIKKEKFPIPDSITDSNLRKIIEISTILDYNNRASVFDIMNILDLML